MAVCFHGWQKYIFCVFIGCNLWSTSQWVFMEIRAELFVNLEEAVHSNLKPV